MGCADVIPGVSGGTIALILGIYGRLVGSIKLLDVVFVKALFTKEFWGLLFKGLFGKQPEGDRPVDQRVRAVLFIGFLVLGILVAIVAAAKIVTYARDQFPEPTRGFFLGLVLASLKVPYRHMKRRGAMQFVVMALFAVGTFLLLGLGTLEQNDPALWYVFLSGAVAISAMILPGISGAFILLMLGMYDPVMLAVKGVVYDQNMGGIALILTLVAGILVGIILFSRLLHYLLNHHHDTTMGALVGLMIGSLRVLWPWKEGTLGEHGRVESLANALPQSFTTAEITTIAVFIVGFAIVFLLDIVGRKMGHEDQA